MRKFLKNWLGIPQTPASTSTPAEVDKVEKTKLACAVTITVDGKQQKIDAEKILIAVGANRVRRTSAWSAPRSARP